MREQKNKMSYRDAMEYMSTVNIYGSVLGLDNTKELLRRLGNPQDQLKFVHVAGTNGKGSVCAYIGTILAKAGYLVGRYISPTILEYRERIQTGQNQSTVFISEEEVGDLIGRIKEVADSMVEEGMPHPTPFEIETAMAFLYYVEKKCDIVILEVGLGGREDSTNVISTTVCSVITSISLDHMQILGDTLTKIAYEKAGIIKYKIPVVSYAQESEAMEVIKEVSEQNHSELTCMSLEAIENVEHTFHGITFDYKEYKKLEIKLLGENQVKNAALAIEAISVLAGLGYRIKEADIRTGLLLTRWPGRFEMIKTEPYFFVDGAHNEDGAKSLRKSIEIYFTNKRIIYIMGVLADKDYHSVLRHTAPYADTIITITPDSSRALSSKELTKAALEYCKNVIDGETIGNAIDIAMELVKKEDVILAFGSLSFLGEIYRHIET
ncbi:dihydrofolate synthase/folylpolyglutamate synthase [Mobilisporobacter senegalensis]|uniref:tetrahydrofolate synthase n=1 Tax=Mobilisporobacter senegalensis TaxID=1329262 RepID=A0A3N1XND0_9FIRM|nr:folylpolyglutamate synthase/dihydrofolate synthase family protein [Mobilisporobacter senegalensis]ROR28156.1 dihydrofolate synthase/folylpolyglutamate synthase [Mobilisporobacter senegalensis]